MSVRTAPRDRSLHRAAALLASAALALGALLASAPPAAAVTCPTVAPNGTVTPAPLTWNTWAGCDLTGAHLGGADMSHMNLTATVLAGADLRGTNLDYADLTGATGLASALTTATTSWLATRCPDTTYSQVHDLGSCAHAVDTMAPVSVLCPVPPAAVGATVYWPFTTDEAQGSGIDTWQLRIRSGASGSLGMGPWRYDSDFSDGPTPRAWTDVRDGTRACVELRLRDLAGNLGPWSNERCTTEPYSTWGIDVTGESSWAYIGDPSWQHDPMRATRAHGARLLLTPKYVRRVGVVATVCPTCGAVDVYVGRARIGHLDLRASRTVAERALTLTTGRLLRGAVTIVTTTKGRLVRVAGIVAQAY